MKDYIEIRINKYFLLDLIFVLAIIFAISLVGLMIFDVIRDSINDNIEESYNKGYTEGWNNSSNEIKALVEKDGYVGMRFNNGEILFLYLEEDCNDKGSLNVLRYSSPIEPSELMYGYYGGLK